MYNKFCRSITLYTYVYLSKVDGPQIDNVQTWGLEKLVTFVGLLQTWQFADLQFADPVFADLTFANPQKINFSPYGLKIVWFKFVLIKQLHPTSLRPNFSCFSYEMKRDLTVKRGVSSSLYYGET